MTSLYKRCQNCGLELGHDATFRKQFCSDKCRVAYHRTKSAQTLYSEAITTISKFSKVSKAEKKAAIENLKALQTIIKHELYLLGDADELALRDMVSDLQRKKENSG